jgi:hypothetical protein
MTERQIGRFSVTHRGCRWMVTHMGSVVSEHSSKLHAITAAKRYNWQERHEKIPPVVAEGEVTQNKWRRAAYSGDDHG